MAFLPKDCCDCSEPTTTSPCECQINYNYIVTASAYYISNFSQPSDCDSFYAYTETSINFSTTFLDITNTLTIPSPSPFNSFIGGSVPCATTGGLSRTFCEDDDSCDPGVGTVDGVNFNFILCGGENSCSGDSSTRIDTHSVQSPSAGYFGSVSATLTGGGYIFSVDQIQVSHNTFGVTGVDLIWTLTPGGTETGLLFFSQNGGMQIIPLYGTWNIAANYNPSASKSGQCIMTLDIIEI